MNPIERVLVAAVGVFLVVATIATQRRLHDLEQRPAGPCAFLRAAALAPGAHAAPPDAGSLSTAAAAREDYLRFGCVPAYGELPHLVEFPRGR